MERRHPRRKRNVSVTRILYTPDIVIIMQACEEPYKGVTLDNVSPWLMSVFVEMALCFAMPGTRWRVDIKRPDTMDFTRKTSTAVITRLS